MLAEPEAKLGSEWNTMSPSERELLDNVVRALRGLRYGSVLLTVHEGKVVEIQKTECIRGSTARLGA
jgi:hypothetical protein